MADKDILADELEAFEQAADAESENRNMALESIRFGRLGEQWPDKIRKQREEEGRPVLTINKMPAFIRQVVNDSRQNRPQIKVKPVDESADTATANVYEGLIRNIEHASKADIAYDTAVESAVSGGWGYIRVSVDYEYDDTFDKCLKIERVANPFSVYGDPFSTSADGSDWNRSWITELLTKENFRTKYKGAEEVNWDDSGYMGLEAPWREGDEILICEAWQRDETQREILLLSNGQVVGAKEYKSGADVFAMIGLRPVNSRMARAYKITQRIMTGAEILEENEWQGQYIPIVPVYGEEINVEGKRHFRSLIHSAMDAQRMFNYWRTTSTELVALAPRVPFIGEEGAFDVDPNWATANTTSHAYLMYAKGSQMPQRQPLDGGHAAGAMAEALAAGDDMKAIMGMYDASLGQRSNETSGKAIMARQREGDTSTFHFIDNLSRSIRHVGCVLVDMIPKVYSGERVIRIIGQDETESTAKIGKKPDLNGPLPEGAEKIYDLSVGRYDVTVDSGPSYTTQREESVAIMTEMIRAAPQTFPVIGDLMVKAMHLPQSEEIAERLKAMMPPQLNGGPAPEIAQQIQDMQAELAKLQQENQQLKTDQQSDMARAGIDARKTDLDAEKIRIEAYKAETERMQAEQAMAAPLPAVPPPDSRR